MVNVGIVGIGFMGMIHYLAYEQLRGAKVAAVCSRDAKKRAGDWRGIQGNFGPPGAKMDLRGVRGYATLDAMLADEDLDLIDVCLPPSMHETAVMAALDAGKHVVCEKPIALTTAAANRMVRKANSKKRKLCIAHVLPYFPEFEFARKAIATKKYGRLLGGHFKRVISDPKWIKDFYNPATVGGPIVDLHIHDAHFVRMLCGMPEAVFAQGRMRGDVVEFMESQWIYGDDGPTIAMSCGVIKQQGRPFMHAFEIHLERATILFNMAAMSDGTMETTPLTVLNAAGKAVPPKLPSGDSIAGFVGELREVCRSINSGQDSEILGGELARDALLLCHKQTQSVASGRIVRV